MLFKPCFGCLLVAAIAWGGPLHADELPPPIVASIEGRTVRIELASGVVYESVEVSRVATHTKTGEPQRLLGTMKSGRRRVFKFGSISRITVDDNATGSVVLYESATAGHDATDRKLTKAERNAKQQADQHQQWLARLTARGIEPWKPLTEVEHAAAIETHKQRYEEVAKLLPSLRLYETEHYLFCTNIPPQQVRVFIASLDRMYSWMQRTYGVDDTESVWRGKASVFAFVTEAQFVAFEQQFMKNNPSGAAGLCHSDSDRNICIAIHQGTDADDFAVCLVHETSHGFIHCYKTPIRVPSWVNEGMAEVIASSMVPTSTAVQRKEKAFVKAMLSSPQPRLGEAFFEVDRNIPFNRYGGASSLTRFLLQTNQEQYVRYIGLLKEGVPWEEAMQTCYHASKPQMVSAYGQWIGIPQLVP